jgi:hypothetical protein
MKYSYYINPASEESVHVLNRTTNEWQGLIVRTKDGRWQSENGKIFGSRDEAADDNGPGEPPTVTVNCSRCGISLEGQSAKDGSFSGRCPKCGKNIDGNAIEALPD